MPTYVYECSGESRTFEVRQSFTDEALTSCPDCSGSVKRLIVGIQFGAGTSLTRKGAKEAADSAKFEKQLEKDRPTYKALKDQGLKPAKMVGIHELATKAETRYEIESGQLIPGKAEEINQAVNEYESATGGHFKKPQITPKAQAS